MADVHDVVAYLLQHSGSLRTLKLQKLLYYSQAWHLVWEEEPLFDSPIQAWANGPVVPEVYRRHRGVFVVDTWEGDPRRLSKVEQATVDAVQATYGRLSGRQLSHLTHREDPWKRARGNVSPTTSSTAEISLDVMQGYYAALKAKEDAVRVDSLAL